MHGDAKSKFYDLNSFAECLKEHRAFHKEAGKIAQCINDKKYKEAEVMLDKNTVYARTSKTVARAITSLKKEIAQYTGQSKIIGSNSA